MTNWMIDYFAFMFLFYFLSVFISLRNLFCGSMKEDVISLFGDKFAKSFWE